MQCYDFKTMFFDNLVNCLLEFDFSPSILNQYISGQELSNMFKYLGNDLGNLSSTANMGIHGNNT